MVVFSKSQQAVFEALVDYVKIYEDTVPLSFVLGFFVSNVMVSR